MSMRIVCDGTASVWIKNNTGRKKRRYLRLKIIVFITSQIYMRCVFLAIILPYWRCLDNEDGAICGLNVFVAEEARVKE